jgi:hypothetical protein
MYVIHKAAIAEKKFAVFLAKHGIADASPFHCRFQRLSTP